jgi:hypothetical protein
MLQLPELSIDGGVGAFAHQHDLRSTAQGIEDGVVDQGEALLAVDATDVGDDRLEVLAEPKAITQHLLAGVLLFHGVRGVLRREELIDLGVPHLIVDAVEHSAEFSVVDLERVLQAHRLVRVQRLPGVLRRDRGHEVRVDDAPFHEVDRFLVDVVPQPIVVEEVRRAALPGGLQDLLAGHTLVREVVNRITDPLVVHPDVLLDFVE